MSSRTGLNAVTYVYRVVWVASNGERRSQELGGLELARGWARALKGQIERAVVTRGADRWEKVE